jgi:hypothetical protein
MPVPPPVNLPGLDSASLGLAFSLMPQKKKALKDARKDKKRLAFF